MMFESVVNRSVRAAALTANRELKDLRILVVDDDQAIRNLLLRWLHHLSCSAMCVGSAAEAIAHMEVHPVDVMFVDVFMPIRDGLSLLAEVRYRWPRTRVVMESGDQAMATVALTRDYGAVAYLSKPYGREQVRQALERTVEADVAERC